MSRLTKFTLGKGAIKAIQQSVIKLFDNLKTRVTGGWGQSKGISVGFNKDLTLPALYNSAAREERIKPSPELLDPLIRAATGYVDSLQEATTANIVHNVEAFVKNAHTQNIEDVDFDQLLHGQLMEALGKAKAGVRRIVDTEATGVRNVGTLDGVITVNDAHGIDDPLLIWLCVHDASTCSICLQLHCLPDGITPRVWRLSDVNQGYYQKGDLVPSIKGLHPHDRCILSSVLPGFGPGPDGRIIYIGAEYDAYEAQRAAPAPKIKPAKKKPEPI